MRHVRDIELIDLAAARLAEDAPVRAHLETCAPCRQRFEQIRAVHSALGSWEVADASTDLCPAILAILSRSEARRGRSLPGLAVRLLRAAAVVFVSVGLGHGVARIWAPGPRVLTAAGADVDAALAVHVLEAPSATGLWLLLDDRAESRDEGGAR